VPIKFKTQQDLSSSSALSIPRHAKPTSEGRVVGCLVADGSETKTVSALEIGSRNDGANFKIVAPSFGERQRRKSSRCDR
jgi:catalase